MNGDSKTIVKLLSEKIDANGRQYNQRFDDFQKHIDEKYGGQQTQINNHCFRIRGLEKHKNIVAGIMIVVTIIITITINYLA